MSIIASAAIRTEGFVPPGPGDFNLPPFGPDKTFEFMGATHYIGVTKPIVLLAISVIVAFGFLYYSIRSRAMVPGRFQYVGEASYGFVRNGLGRDIIGSQDFMRFVPYLVALFFFIWVNNFFGLFPLTLFPSFSRASMAYALAFIAWLVYNGAGIQRHGFLGYLRRQTVPSGVSGPVLGLLIPLEFLSNIIVRPVTLALRLFANMFAGHLLLMLFAVGGEYLLFHTDGLTMLAGPVSWLMFILICFLELLVLTLQAYVFTLLSAMYISSSLADEH